LESNNLTVHPLDERLEVVFEAFGFDDANGPVGFGPVHLKTAGVTPGLAGVEFEFSPARSGFA
jgi:hypothetical protein